ncbi:GYDIA family GHMP kinase [Ichthyenterobacterium magnum]|uniref:Mevalonate kinase n=1 Tax=Ichthyenterobacterium magnum TaxID=1230530 RepID=A0A420DVY8_9FLAO|nr:GYDIA family GHMP kinase [Ichthyenterobacterium magnum]RKE98383.1 mevalonate kinase [Ichthyenterobacterium magnum]
MKFYSNGKLLLTGEYVVLDGALSLAVPTKFGQALNIEVINDPKLIWNSFDEHNIPWFEAEFELQDNKIINQASTTLSAKTKDNNPVAERLLQILSSAQKLNPKFLNSANGYIVTTSLGFPKNWGLGTSSTLINNIANWAKVDAFKLLELTFGGSGYDIACANNNSPITYQLHNNSREISSVEFKPKFKDHLYFVYLNKKQNSRDGIAQYKTNTANLSEDISAISTITKKIITCQSLKAFNLLISQHEQLISNIIKQPTIKDALFNDFKGCIKSLGAWGGDFILVASKENPTNYFKAKGFTTIINYNDMVLN